MALGVAKLIGDMDAPRHCSKCETPREVGARCKPCTSDYQANYRAAHVESLRAYHKTYSAVNVEAKREYNSTYYAKNAPEMRAYAAAYRREHPDQIRSANERQYLKNIAERLAYQKDYASHHSVELRLYSKAYREANRDKVRQSAKKRYAKNAEHNRIKARDYRLEHPADPAAARVRKARWWKANRAKVRAKCAARRARKKGARGSHTTREFRAKCQAFGYRCIDCGMREGEQFANGTVMALTEGHAIPLTPRHGSGFGPGSDFIGNIIPQCAPCNGRQGNRFVHPSVLAASLFDQLASSL